MEGYGEFIPSIAQILPEISASTIVFTVVFRTFLLVYPDFTGKFLCQKT
jgi:hypothetical protein